MSTAPIVGTNTSAPRVVRQAPGALTVEVRTDVSWSAADQDAIEAFIVARPHVGLFLTRAWLSGFFADPPDGASPSLLMFREAGVLRGMVPLAIRDTVTHTCVSLLGGGAGSDRVDLLAARGHESACADRFIDWLERECPRGYVLELRDVPGDSSLWGAIGRAAGEKRPRLMLAPREIYALPYLPLHESQGPLGAPIANDAASLARHWRWLERKCHLRIETIADANDGLEALEVLTDLLRARWGSEGSALENPRLQRFHQHVLPLLLQEGRLRMLRLLGDMRPIAIFYGVAGGHADAAVRGGAGARWWGYYLAGYDRQWAGRIHLGRIALAAAIDAASKEGAVDFDFLKGPERVKYSWPVRERVTIDADVYSCAIGPRLTWATRAARSAAGAIVRSTCDIRR